MIYDKLRAKDHLGLAASKSFVKYLEKIDSTLKEDMFTVEITNKNYKNAFDNIANNIFEIKRNVKGIHEAAKDIPIGSNVVMQFKENIFYYKIL